MDIRKPLEILNKKDDSKLETNMNSCVKCGLCAESCMYYLAFKEAQYVPGAKAELVSSIYRRYNTFTGKIAPSLFNANKLDKEMADKMVDMLFGACTMCGRCVKQIGRAHV